MLSRSEARSAEIQLPNEVIGQTDSITVVDGLTAHGGIIYARKTDKVLKLGLDGQFDDKPIEIRLYLVANSAVRNWPASIDRNVKFNNGFHQTLQYHSNNLRQGNHNVEV